MPEVLFLLAIPTPQRTPALDSMADAGVDLHALYHRARDTTRGWGDISPRHSHEVVPAGVWASCLFVFRKVRQRDVRVLCCFGYNFPANIVGVLTARACGVRVVTRSDSSWTQEQQRSPMRIRAKRWFIRMLFGRRTRVWTVGAQNEQFWAAMGLTDQVLIPYGVPAPPIGSADEGESFRRDHVLGPGPVALFVGNLEPHKGIDTLLAAFDDVADPTARLVMVGRGSLANTVEAAAVADPRIRACGALPQRALGGAYAAADFFVLPSRQERWGLVVDEAQANGLPVVVSDAVGCADDRVEASTGRVFRAGDRADLARVLREVFARCSSRGWPVPRREPYNAAADMAADLVRLGVSTRD
jgi:glycosyltransferase involved in cell wall biosynthesis